MRYVEDQPAQKLREEIETAEQYLREFGHTLNCGQQDALSDQVVALREELAERAAPDPDALYEEAQVRTMESL